MSKIGKLPIAIPQGVTVSFQNGIVTVNGPKGSLTLQSRPEVAIQIADNTVTTSIQNDDHKKYRGLTRTLIGNMIIGVTKGYQKQLKVIGVGYDAKVQGSTLILSLGFSHPVDFSIPQGIEIKVEKDPKGNAIVSVDGADKVLVGQTAAKIRDYRPPEPYKGKGVRYLNEIVRLKAGKSAKK